MDEKMISELRKNSAQHWKKIVEKYGSNEKDTVLDYKDFLQGRQAASVTLHGCSVELPIHRQNFIEFNGNRRKRAGAGKRGYPAYESVC